ncbi:MAG: type I-B CRISPR-associated protein Cas7/Cst2/DevR [Polyangiaceae bacterium]|nr:type I-B CRISPR-associated protein Cas7/Cst2/DevR [Polyangiaceae bacterium]
MSHLTGLLVIDAPASALNNAGKDEEARTDNAVAVKFIRTPEGRYPYVSAQAVRFWLRTQLAQTAGWTTSPVFRETKVAYTDAEPTKYAEDDLFGYMRAASKSGDEKKAAKRAEIAKTSTPVGEDVGELTRISPLRVGTMVSTVPVRIVRDWGTMARAEGDPVPYEHQFYRASLKGGVALDLACAGTFFVSQRVGYKNLDAARVASAQAAQATQVSVRGFQAWRLPVGTRQARTATVVRALGKLEGGAKQTLHLTDTAPAALVLAVCKHGNQPFQRLFTASEDGETTSFRDDVLTEVLRVYGADLVSDVYIGWAKGFLDAERKKLAPFLEAGGTPRVHLLHPVEAANAMAEALEKNGAWFD